MNNYFQTDASTFYMLLIWTSAVAVVFHAVLLAVHFIQQKRNPDEMIRDGVEMLPLENEE